MSVPTMRTPRSPFVRSARKSAAVPGAPEAVTRTVMSRIAARCYLGAGEEEPDAVPACGLAAVLAAEVGADCPPAEATRDERLLRAAVELGADGVLRGRRKGVGEAGELRAGRGPVGQGAGHGGAAQRVAALGCLIGPVRPDRDVQRR